MGAVISRIKEFFVPPKPTKITAQMIKKKEREESIQRQIVEELLEVNVDMHFVFGDAPPEKKADVFTIKNVTSRNLWMEDLYLFNAIKAFAAPDALFHPPSMYVLKWQPLGISYKLLVPLENVKIQDDVLNQLFMIPPGPRDLVLFYFCPMNPTVPLYRPFVHPATLVSFRTKVDVLNKLCELFLDGKITIMDLQDTLASQYDIWKLALFNMLPDDWQSYHLYLKEKTIVAIKETALEKDYVAGNIELQTYIDFKFPERKRLRDIQALTYPQPYTYSTCVICGSDKGVISCESCNNVVCVSCVETVFLNEETKEGSFLLMHRRYCLKLGKIRVTPPQLVQESAYLRLLRMTGRAAAMERLMPKPPPKVEVKADDDGDSVDEEELFQQELERKRAEEERQRRLLECPPELEHIIETIKKMEKKLEKHKKEVFDAQGRLDEGGHSDTYTVRIERLKSEEINKMRKQLIDPLVAFNADIDAMNLYTSATAKLTLQRIALLTGRAERLAAITSIKEYEKLDKKAEEAFEEPPPVDISALADKLISKEESGDKADEKPTSSGTSAAGGGGP